jgi:hypothetical protein
VGGGGLERSCKASVEETSLGDFGVELIFHIQV